MKIWKGLIASVAIASLSLLSYPGASFGQDCTYGGAFKYGELTPENGYCVISGEKDTKGSLIITSANWLFIKQGLNLSVNEEPNQQFPFVTIPGTLLIQPGGTFGTIQPVLNPIKITAAGEILNAQGAINLWAPTDPIEVRAGKGINLQGAVAPFDPPSLFVGDTVKLETTRGNLLLGGSSTVLISIGDAANVTLKAPRGSIATSNTTIAVFKGGSSAELGECVFQAKNQQSVFFGPNTNLLCIPRIKK
jgi:hypothetical protein